MIIIRKINSKEFGMVLNLILEDLSEIYRGFNIILLELSSVTRGSYFAKKIKEGGHT